MDTPHCLDSLSIGEPQIDQPRIELVIAKTLDGSRDGFTMHELHGQLCKFGQHLHEARVTGIVLNQ